MKKITILFISLFISCQVFSQFNPYWSDAFQYTVSSGYSNEARKVAIDASGNIFVLSDITSDIDSANHPGPTQYYVVLRKYTPAGVLMVQKIVNVNNMNVNGTYNYSSAFTMKIDGSNNIYIGYNRYNSSGANYDVGVIKYNNSMTSHWSYLYSTPANETGVDMVLRESTAFVLVKSVSGVNTTYVVIRATPNLTNSTALYSFDTNIDVVNSMTTSPLLNCFFTGYRIVGGAKVAMAASVTPGGSLKWKSTFNNGSASGDDYGTKIMLGNDGFLYVAGTTYTNATYGNAAMLLRFNASNGIMNAKLALNYNLGNSNNDIGFDIVEGASGVKFLGAVCGTLDVVVYKIITTNGLTVNATSNYKPVPSSFSTLIGLNISDFKVASSNNVYVTGSITGTSPSGNFSASYLTKFGMASGVFTNLGSTTVDGDFNENYQGVGITLDATRNTLINIRNFWNTNFNHSIENIIIDDYNMNSLRLNQDAGNSNSLSNEIVVYPNPASGIIYLKNVQSEDIIEVYDLSGKLVNVLNLVDQSADISMLSRGIYLLRIRSSNDVIIKKIVVE